MPLTVIPVMLPLLNPQVVLLITMLVVLMVGPVVLIMVKGPAVAVHPAASVTTSVYDPAGMDVILVPGYDVPFHWYVNVPVPPEAVIPVILPLLNPQLALVRTIAVVLIVGEPVFAMVNGPLVAVHPAASVTVSVYEPAATALRVALGVDVPFQLYANVPVPPVAVIPVILPLADPHVALVILIEAELMVMAGETVIVTGNR